ncbi:MAG: VUT family protein [Gammaproteobacteria bacterium]|nr:MAG: VUT family protein [Gammaproteobacteria bacterium]
MLKQDQRMRYQYKYFTFLSMFYSTLLTVSVLLPYKIINLFGFSEPGGIFIFPLTYLLSGAIAETYGRSMALRMVYFSLFCLFVFNISIAIIIRIPSMPDTPHQEVFIQAFGQGIRLAIGCFVGLICSDLTNVYRITKLKLLFGGKYFIQRCLWSTAISEILFNITAYIITYTGVLPPKRVFQLILYSWLLKMIYSLIMIFPLLLLMKFLKSTEKIDICDVTGGKTSPLNPETILIKFLNFTSNPKTTF